MSEQLLCDEVNGPQGTFEVSTIRTDAGGAAPSGSFSNPFFTSADYVDETPWPFETMIFRNGSRVGVYHEPHRTEQQARDGHRYAVSIIKAGTLRIGSGVTGAFGTPSTTPEEWADRIESKA